MKKFTKTKIARNVCMGGVLVLSAILALSLMFASCANSSDSDSDNNGGNNTGITDNNNGSNNSNSDVNNSNNSNGNSNGNNGGNSSSNNGGSSNDNNDSNNSSGSNNNSNGGSNNNDNSSSTLPVSVGNNPIKETVKLITRKDMYLELKTDGTATYGDDYKGEEEYKFKYTYDENKKEIYLKVEKSGYSNPFGENLSELITYNEILSKLNKDCNVENARKYFKELYEYEKDKEYFKEEYPDCNSYEDFEAEIYKDEDFDSLDDYVKYAKQVYEDLYKVYFGAQITYNYEIEDGKITLTEKFTGVKNLLNSRCGDKARSCRIYSTAASIEENDIYYYGIPNIDNKTITFKSSEKDNSTYESTYTENISTETVTIKFKDKEYVCEFEGEIFIQE